MAPSTPFSPSSTRNFANRRNGVMKKANALSRLHGARVAVFVEWGGSISSYHSHSAWPPVQLNVAPGSCFSPDHFDTVADRVSPPALPDPSRNVADIPAAASDVFEALQSYIASEHLHDLSSVASDTASNESSASSYSPGKSSVDSFTSFSTGTSDNSSVVDQPVIAGPDRTAPLPVIVGVDQPVPPPVVAASPDDAFQEAPLRRTPRRALNTRSQQRAKRYFDQ